MKCPTKLNKNLRSFHKDEHEDVNNIKTNMKRGSKRPATAALSCLCRRFAYDKKNVGIINKDIRNFAEITNEQSMRIMITETFKECINDSLGETFIHNRYRDSRTQINMLQSYVGIMVPKSAFC